MEAKTKFWDEFTVVDRKPNGDLRMVKSNHDGCDYRKANIPTRKEHSLLFPIKQEHF